MSLRGAGGGKRAVRAARRRGGAAGAGLEALEPRTLLSAAVTVVSRNAIHSLAALPNETGVASPKFSDLWHLRNTGQTLSASPSGPDTGTPGADIKATDAWDLTTGSKSVVIALFDTGLDLTHPDLAGNVWQNPGEIAGNGIDDDGNGFVDDVNGWNFVDGNNNVQDTSLTNHGTTVAGVLAAQGNNGTGIAGTNWNVSVLTVKVGTDSGVSDTDLINGINYVKGLKAKGVNIVVVNASYLSFGAPSFSSFSSIKSLGDQGILYVSAAGNSSMNLDSLGLPFILPSNEIFVAATDNQDNLASFSSYGKSSVALGAPGVDIVTTLRGGFYGVLSGTSYAGPMVSGAIALMKAAVPSATMAQIKSALLGGVDVVPGLSGKVSTGGRLNVYRSIELLQGPLAPTGWVDALTKDGVSGWAFDANAGAKAVTVQIAVDGKVVATVPANGVRNDLAGVLGSANHAFSYSFSGLTSGQHTVQVYAADYAPFGTTLAPMLIGQAVLTTASAPTGAIDVAGPTQVMGWAVDRDTPASSLAVRLDVDGTTVATGTANLARNDLTPLFGSANHGYAFTLPSNLAVGMHVVNVYALDSESGASQLIGTRAINTNVPPQGYLDVFDGATLAGWAFDGNAGADPVQVLYQLDTQAPTLVTANAARNDLTAVVGSPNHGFSVTLPRLTQGTHTVTVWAVDPTTQALVGLGQRSVTAVAPAATALPQGTIDLASATRVAGWVWDADLGGAASTVRIDVDGATVTTVTANVARPDLMPYVGGANFGYSQALSLGAGEHRIDVYTLDQPSNTLTLIGSRIVAVPVATPAGLTAPAGSVDLASATTIAGWAYLPALGGGPATVRIDIDGVPALLTTANSARGDLTSYLGGANYAFSGSTPALLPGTHTVRAWIVDPATLAATEIGSRTLTV